MRLLLFIFSLFILNSCGSASKNAKNPIDLSDLQGNYSITTLQDNELTSENLSLNFDKENNLSGYTGCNNFSSNYVVEGKEINFSPPIATHKYCEGQMDTEKMLFSVLSKTKTIVSASENEIAFLSEKGTEILRAKKEQ